MTALLTSESITAADVPVVDFDTEPSAYRHWKLECDAAVATLTLAVDPHGGLAPGYELKMNSYDLGVDIELYDAVQRLRFEHPEVKAIVVTGGLDRMFCAGANIRMLAQSTHAWKVNFCKFTNETRNGIEDATENSGQTYIAALNGTSAGGGYELAAACDQIVLIDDGSSAVSLPEVPLLGVLPGTGGLTRVVDKRKVRKDRADVFSTLAEGLKGKRAKEWRLIDDTFPTSKFQESIETRVKELTASDIDDKPVGIKLNPVEVEIIADKLEYKYVSLALHREQRYADLTMLRPDCRPQMTVEEIHRAGDTFWPLQ